MGSDEEDAAARLAVEAGWTGIIAGTRTWLIAIRAPRVGWRDTAINRYRAVASRVRGAAVRTASIGYARVLGAWWGREAVRGKVGRGLSKANLAASARVVAYAHNGRARVAELGVFGSIRRARRVPVFIGRAEENEVARARRKFAAAKAIAPVRGHGSADINASVRLIDRTVDRRGTLLRRDIIASNSGAEGVATRIPYAIVVSPALVRVVITIARTATYFAAGDSEVVAGLVVVTGAEAIRIEAILKTIAIIV